MSPPTKKWSVGCSGSNEPFGEITEVLKVCLWPVERQKWAIKAILLLGVQKEMRKIKG